MNYDLLQMDSRQYLITQDGIILLNLTFTKRAEDALGQDGLKKVIKAAAKELVQRMVSGEGDE